MDLKKQAACVARSFIRENNVVGLGDGQAVRWLASFLLEDMRNGFRVQLCTSSERTKQFLLELKIPVIDLPGVSHIDQYFDGCDQIDSALNVIKSGAGIHTIEKLYASVAREFIIIAERSKWVSALDTAYPIVLEIIPQSATFVAREMSRLFPGIRIALRTKPGENNNVITVNGNFLFDCRFLTLPDPALLSAQCKQITGVLEHSLFYQMVHRAIIAGSDATTVYERKNGQVIQYNFNDQQKYYEHTEI